MCFSTFSARTATKEGAALIHVRPLGLPCAPLGAIWCSFALPWAPLGAIWCSFCPPLGLSWRHLVFLSRLFGATLVPLGLWHDWWSCPPVTRGLPFGLQDRKRDWRTCAMGGICTGSSLRLASLCFALLRSDWIGLDNTSKDFGGSFQRG